MTQPALTEWIPVETRLPDSGILVLICTSCDNFIMAAYDEEEGWTDAGDISLRGFHITHWCDPTPPYLTQKQEQN